MTLDGLSILLLPRGSSGLGTSKTLVSGFIQILGTELWSNLVGEAILGVWLNQHSRVCTAVLGIMSPSAIKGAKAD